ncbi:hypothetical protein [Streptomyces sp. NPDC005507]|uniref:hypothetical protein n=1 Tax=unclassified Streptomyces TaxID=2593676 RepID=UPI0033BA150D
MALLEQGGARTSPFSAIRPYVPQAAEADPGSRAKKVVDVYDQGGRTPAEVGAALLTDHVFGLPAARSAPAHAAAGGNAHLLLIGRAEGAPAVHGTEMYALVGQEKPVILSPVYAVTRRLLSLPAMLLPRDVSKDSESLVLRHENAVLRRHVPRMRYEPAHRLWFASHAGSVAGVTGKTWAQRWRGVRWERPRSAAPAVPGSASATAR